MKIVKTFIFLLLLIQFFIKTLPKINTNNLHPKTDNFTILAKSVVLMVEQITKDYQTLRTKLLIVNENHSSQEHRTINSAISDLITKQLNKITEISSITENFRKRKWRQMRFFNLILIDSLKAFDELLASLSVDEVHGNGFFIIILTKIPKDIQSTIFMMFSSCFRRYIVNAVVLVKNNDLVESNIDIYSYRVNSNKYCGRIQPYLINKFINNSFGEKINLNFGKRMENFFKCRIKVLTWENLPFMTVGRTKNERQILGGIEGKFLELSAQHLNFTIELDGLSQNSDNPQGFVFQNGSASGAFEKIIGGQANLVIGGCGFTTLKSKYMTPSAVLLRHTLLIAVPPGKTTPPFAKLLLPFRLELSIAVQVIILLAFFVIFLLTIPPISKYAYLVSGMKNNEAYLNVISVLLGNPLPYLPIGYYSRYLFINWSIFTLVLRTVYTGELYQIMQKPERTFPVKTFEDLMSENYELLADYNAYNLFDGEDDISDHRFTLTKKSVNKLLDSMQNSNTKIAVLTLDAVIAYYNSINWHTRNVKLLEEGRRPVEIVIYFRKHSYLVPAFNKLIEGMITNGILLKWQNEHLDGMWRKNIQRKLRLNEPVPYTLNNLVGLIQILVVFQTLAVFIFLIEIATVQCKTYSFRGRRSTFILK